MEVEYSDEEEYEYVYSDEDEDNIDDNNDDDEEVEDASQNSDTISLEMEDAAVAVSAASNGVSVDYDSKGVKAHHKKRLSGGRSSYDHMTRKDSGALFCFFIFDFECGGCWRCWRCILWNLEWLYIRILALVD